ncbi:hypothetical protein M6D93_04180 [Jatrophihabitans telluris]|uniref:Uncharacterized protein n=1 Tax=Jatrophihabitans telluris TaxID=2038343 RepID=A0ABY4R115_9ACTN|nr:hypothetical protein [Jatrophihabitans telluris]UQX89207.1 hypothetical protein M6D93_04180 [Jatrophihabitans telluris]
MKFELVRGPDVADDGDATLIFESGKEWRVTVTRNLNAPIGGPEKLVIEAVDGSEGGKGNGGYDTEGIQTTHLRAVPIAEARRLLEGVLIQRQAQSVIERLPEDFEGEYAYAALASAIVTLTGWNVTNAVAAIARAKAGLTETQSLDRKTRDLWSTRAKRARTYGFLADLDGQPVLTAKASAALGG